MVLKRKADFFDVTILSITYLSFPIRVIWLAWYFPLGVSGSQNP